MSLMRQSKSGHRRLYGIPQPFKDSVPLMHLRCNTEKCD